jgi:hypothetical protein
MPIQKLKEFLDSHNIKYASFPTRSRIRLRESRRSLTYRGKSWQRP